jgi:hypothetical protein
MTTALDPAKPTAPCPVCGFPTITGGGAPPTICTRCRAQAILVAWQQRAAQQQQPERGRTDCGR